MSEKKLNDEQLENVSGGDNWNAPHPSGDDLLSQYDLVPGVFYIVRECTGGGGNRYGLCKFSEIYETSYMCGTRRRGTYTMYDYDTLQPGYTQNTFIDEHCEYSFYRSRKYS